MGRKSSKFMNKKVASLFLATALTVTQFAGVAWNQNVVWAEEQETVPVQLLDNEFTGDLWGDNLPWEIISAEAKWTVEKFWYNTNSDLQKGEEEGETAAKFWMENGGKVQIKQKLNLKAGTYAITSYVMGEKTKMRIFVGDNYQNTPVALSGWNSWDTVTNTFTVVEDDEEIYVGIEADAEVGGYGYIDQLTITGYEQTAQTWLNTNLITNGDFETGNTIGWEFVQSNDNAIKYNVKTDAGSGNITNFINIWNGSENAQSFSMTQTVENVPAGTYKLSFQQEGGAMPSGLKVSVNGIEKSLPATTEWGKWETVETESFTLEAAGTVTVAVKGDVNGKYWADFDDFVLKNWGKPQNEEPGVVEEDTSVEADIYVEKNKAIDEDFITGADVSSYLSEINSGVKFYDFDGNKLDEQRFFDFLKENGTNYIRLRVWNNPYDASGNGYGGGNNDLDAAVKMGRWATVAGMKVLIDFHYSDFWADPGKQQAPKAWKDMSVTEKETAVYDYTKASLQKLLDAGVDVGMVQVGNETNNGICGENKNNWTNMAKIFSAGSKAIRDISATSGKEILVAVHFANPEKAGTYATYAKNLSDNDVDYDVFASSYYPYWHGTTSNLTSVLKNIADTYGKKVMVAETSWATTIADGDGHDNTVRTGSNDTGMPYNFTVQGQATEMAAVAKAVTDVGEAGIGLFYWEAAWIPVQYAYDADGNVNESVVASNKTKWETNGSGWASSYAGEYDAKDAGEWYGGSAVDNQAWFDFNGNALETVKLYNYLHTGTKVKEKVESVIVENVEAECTKVDKITLPEKATVKYNTGKSTEVAVSWNEQELTAAKTAGVGSYTIHGTVTIDEQEQEITTTLTILPKNWLVNPAFDDKLAGWTISNASLMNDKDASSNSRTKEGCLHFYAGENDMTSTATQTVVLPAGKYQFSGYLQGGAAGETDVFSITASVGEKAYTATGVVSGWKEWAHLQTDSFEVSEDNTEVTVEIRVANTTIGVWGSYDDMYLCEVQETTPADEGNKEEVKEETKEENKEEIKEENKEETKEENKEETKEENKEDTQNTTEEKAETKTEIKAETDEQPVVAKPQVTVKKIAKASLSKTECTYSGNEKKPSVTVFDEDGNVVPATAYIVTYKNNVKVGTASVVITANADNGQYTGSVTKSFKINPKETKAVTVKATANRVKVQLNTNTKQVAKQITGYQIRYSTKKNMKSAKVITAKKSAKTKTIKNLSKNKKYYVQTRTYKVVNGKKYYSEWSKPTVVKTK